MHLAGSYYTDISRCTANRTSKNVISIWTVPL